MESTRVLRRTVLAAALAGVAAATTAAGPALAADPTGSISGIVRDTRGAVVADASIAVYPEESINPVQELPVDSAGRFTVTGLKPGNYQIDIGMSGWSEWAPGRTEDRSRARTYRVTANRDTVANSVVTTAGFIAGRILGPDGSPAAGAAVNIDNVDDLSQHAGVTGADGTYRIKVQPNSTFIVSHAVGPISQYVPHTFDSAEATRFFVRSGRTVRVDDRAIPAAGMSGRVTDAAGAPAAGVSVEVINVETIRPSEMTTDADGTYDFTGLLEPGRYKVRFTASGRSQYAHQKPDYDSADVITLTSGETTVIDDQLLWVPTAR